MDIENYIKDLSPELQEKARSCKNTEELIALAKNENVPLPDEALAAIAGGDDGDTMGGYNKCGRLCCDRCGSKDISTEVLEHYAQKTWYCTCKKCGYHFYTDGTNTWSNDYS